MKTRYGFTTLLVVCAAAFAPRAALAALFTIDCGAGGATTALQDQITALGSTPNNQINMLGTCVGDVDVSRTDRLTITNLSLTGSLTANSASTLRMVTLTLNGGLAIFNTRNSTFSGLRIRGDITVIRGSQVSFGNLISNTWTDAAGTHDPAFNCTGQSECTVNVATLTGAGTSTASVGLLAGSGARLNFYAGTITGFGTGVQSWNNATTFVTALCDPISIRGNRVAGVFAADGGIVKVFGMTAQEAVDSGCPAPVAVTVDIASNGKYGVLADGGGDAYLQLTRITGHSLDGVRVQHGSVVRVRNSSIDAATTSRRSARVSALAHLYFDEQEAGPAARSTLAGPVCVTGSATVDTDNSSTVLTVQRSCSGP